MTQEETKAKCDDIFEKHFKIICFEDGTNIPIPIVTQLKMVALKHAIISTEQVIDTLKVVKNTRVYNGKAISIENELELDEQIEILSELKSRL